MQSSQANGVRLIYTISTESPSSGQSYCLLKNGYYFSKEARSDEKLRYTESDITGIVRVVLFSYVFDVTPQESMLELINDGNALTLDIPERARPLTINIAVSLLDSLFGARFAEVVRHSLTKIYNEYQTKWRFYNYGQEISCPNVQEYVKLARFINLPLPRYTSATLFVNTNSTDSHIRLQGQVKNLDS